MTAYIQYSSKSVAGLEYVIDINTGDIFATQRAVARLIEKEAVYVRNFAKTRENHGGKFSDSLEVRVLTPGGLQGGKLFNFSFILAILTKYKPEVMMTWLEAGGKVFIYTDTGYAPGITASNIVEGATSWDAIRKQGQGEHMNFCNAVKAKKHPGAIVHNLITKLVTGLDAHDARRLPMVNNQNPTIGLNHQPSEAQLQIINDAKRLYCGYRKGSYRDQALRAVFHASPE